MTHAKGSILVGEWPVLRPKQKWTVGKKRGPNINRRFPVPASPYAKATHKKVLERYLTIMLVLEKVLIDRKWSLSTGELGKHLDLTPAAVGITCDHLCDYLKRNGLQATNILEKSMPRGIGASWEAKEGVATGIALIKQHMRQVPK